MTTEEHEDKKTIGQMNGLWGLLFKISLVIHPFLLTWCIWITQETFANRYFRIQGDRVTPMDMMDLERKLDERFDNLPPDIWKQKILSTETKLDTLLQTVIRIETSLKRDTKP